MCPEIFFPLLFLTGVCYDRTQDCFRENAQRFCWVNVSKADQNRVSGLTCVHLKRKMGE